MFIPEHQQQLRRDNEPLKLFFHILSIQFSTMSKQVFYN